MAKKKTALQEPEIMPGDVQILEAEVIEIPQELAVIKQEYGLKLSDDLIDNHIKTYAPYFKELVDLEPEMTALLTKEITADTMKEATALRKKYRDIRTATDKQKKADKESIVVEGKFLDKIFNRVKEAAESKEANCEEIENKLEQIENDRIAALRSARIATLEALDYDTEFLTVEDMTEESFARIVSKATAAKEALELSEKQREEAAQLAKAQAEKKTTRINMLATIGLTFSPTPDGDFYAGKDGDVKAEILTASDEVFHAAFSVVSNARDKRVQAEADALQAEKDAAAKLTARINRVNAVGFRWDESRQVYELGNDLIKLDSMKAATDEAFEVVMLEVEERAKAEKEAAKKFESRLDKLEAIGMVYNAEADKYENDDYEADSDGLRTMSDEDFNELVSTIEADNAKAKESAERLETRVKALATLGFAEAEQGFALNEDYISTEDISTWSAEQFSEIYSSFKKNVELKKKQDDEALTEAKRIKAEQEAEIEAKRVAALAPDKEKMLALYKAFVALPFPEMSTTEGKAAIERVLALSVKFKDFIIFEGKKLA